MSSFILPFGVVGLAIFGAIVSAVWLPIAYALGRRYEHVRSGEVVGRTTMAQPPLENAGGVSRAYRQRE